MHAIYRNFISALRFNKTAAILNIMGLAIAYIVFATIYAQVDFANKFDRFHPQVDHIYRVDCKTPASVWSVHSRLLIDAFVSTSPYIQKSTLINPFIGECYFTTDVNGNQTGFKDTVQTCSPDITGIFDFVFRRNKTRPVSHLRKHVLDIGDISLIPLNGEQYVTKCLPGCFPVTDGTEWMNRIGHTTSTIYIRKDV